LWTSALYNVDEGSILHSVKTGAATADPAAAAAAADPAAASEPAAGAEPAATRAVVGPVLPPVGGLRYCNAVSGCCCLDFMIQ